jgi:drug/metabolite transporter (DMT)-like permease
MTIRLLSRWLSWMLVLAIAVVTLAPIELRPVTAASANWERSAAFMALGALFCLGYPRHRWRIVGLVIALAGLLELLQHMSPSRHGRLPDGLVKAAGALLGVALAVSAERIFGRLRTSSGPRRDPRVPPGTRVRTARQASRPEQVMGRGRAGLSDTAPMASERGAKSQNQPHAL